MKSKILSKKLTLKKETIARLGDKEMNKVVGALNTKLPPCSYDVTICATLCFKCVETTLCTDTTC